MTSPRLLFIESDPFFAGVATRQLRRVGFDVVHVTHAIESLECLKQESFDLLLTELILPRMDGYQLLEAIRAQAHTEHLPVVVLSRLGTREDVERCRLHGIREYFIKPHHRLDWIAERLFQGWRQYGSHPV